VLGEGENLRLGWFVEFKVAWRTFKSVQNVEFEATVRSIHVYQRTDM
jgi:hypothetical protein